MSFLPLLNYSNRQALKLIPGVLEIITLARRGTRRQLATKSSRICIDSFPRSGTSYAVSLVVDGLRLPRTAVASHTHSVANIRRAVVRQMPTFVLIRDPLPACLSLLVWGADTNLVDALRTYHHFYTGLLPIVDRTIVVPFEVLIESPHLVFDKLALSLKIDERWSDAKAKSIAQARTEHDFLGLDRSHEVRRRNLPNATKEDQKIALLRRHFTAEAKEWYAQCQRLRIQIIAAAPNKIESIGKG